MFRATAARLHPDREPDPEKRLEKQKLMADLLKARKKGDLLTVFKMYQQHTDNPESFSKADEKQLIEALEKIPEYIHLYKLRKNFEQYIFDLTNQESMPDSISVYGLRRNLNILDNRISEILATDYQQYDFSETSEKWIKSFHIYHDNDVFLFDQNLNGDRDYTGGIRLELTTDKLKMRLFKNINSDKILSYQSFLFGGEGYTPYIRFDEQTFDDLNIVPTFENGFLSEASRTELSNKLSTLQEPFDRPFASFQYFARGKYRVHFKGRFRSASFFKLGTVGGRIGERVQQILHQDVITSSKRVLNWDRQIANGGRVGFNIEHNIDFYLYSKFFKLAKYQSHRERNVLHVYLPTEIAFGNVNTHVGFGLGLSNKTFLQTNSHFELKYKREFTDCSSRGNLFSFDRFKCAVNRIWQHTYVGLEYRVRRVYHNSMLNGLGYIDKFEDDEFDDEKPSVYVLPEEFTADWLHRINFTLSIQLRRASLYYRYTRFLNREFEVLPNNSENSLYQTPERYGYGTFGFIVKI